MSLSVNSETREIIHDGLVRFLIDNFAYSVEVFVWLKDGIYEYFLKKSDVDIVPTYDEDWEFLGSVILPADPGMLLEKRKKDVLKLLYDKVNSVYLDLLSPYTSLEKESWQQQEEEARALKAVKTPTIDKLCIVRGCSRDELADKIIANADAAKNAGISVLAWQQGIEKKIKEMKVEDYDYLVGEING